MSDKAPAVPGVVLAGGRSSRMGTDKSVLVVDGMRLVDRALQALRGAGVGPLFISGSVAGHVATDVTTVADRAGQQGPLDGIVSTWAYITGHDLAADRLVVLSCDLPNIDAPMVTSLLRAWTEGNDAVLAHDGERLQPLVAVYSARALADMTTAWNGGERSVRRLFAGWSLTEVSASTQATDADEPADLEAHHVVWPTRSQD